MTISKLVQVSGGWNKFNLNVGGFTIKNCRWHPARGAILFPVRYDRAGGRHPVVHVWGSQVMRLRALLQSGQMATRRDRRPCQLMISSKRMSFGDGGRRLDWLIFSFTVRGFTIQGCRWHPKTGSIQLPVTFLNTSGLPWGHVKKQVVCAWGTHIERLRRALEEQARDYYDDAVSVAYAY